eukprot:scaffold1372_cov351-Pavlova_lutheri.AAC.8
MQGWVLFHQPINPSLQVSVSLSIQWPLYGIKLSGSPVPVLVKADTHSIHIHHFQLSVRIAVGIFFRISSDTMQRGVNLCHKMDYPMQAERQLEGLVGAAPVWHPVALSQGRMHIVEYIDQVVFRSQDMFVRHVERYGLWIVREIDHVPVFHGVHLVSFQIVGPASGRGEGVVLLSRYCVDQFHHSLDLCPVFPRQVSHRDLCSLLCRQHLSSLHSASPSPLHPSPATTMCAGHTHAFPTIHVAETAIARSALRIAARVSFDMSPRSFAFPTRACPLPSSPIDTSSDPIDTSTEISNPVLPSPARTELSATLSDLEVKYKINPFVPSRRIAFSRSTIVRT